MEAILIDLKEIDITMTQTRAGLREEAVEEYAALIKDGTKFDPAVVFKEGAKHWLAAGFHRYAAHQKAGKTQMYCQVREGGKREAIEFGIKDNLAHRGERLTNADKRHNIDLVLREWPDWCDRTISEMVGVHHGTVAKRRLFLESSGELASSDMRVDRRGRRHPVESVDTPSDTPMTGDLCDMESTATALAVPSPNRVATNRHDPAAAQNCSSPKPKPQTLKEQFEDALRSLAKVAAAVDRLRRTDEGLYQRARKQCETLGASISQWRESVA